MRVINRRVVAMVVLGGLGVWALVGCGGPKPATDSGARKEKVAPQETRPAEPQAEALTEASAAAVDLTKSGVYAKTWVNHVQKCDVSPAGDGALVCTVVGSSQTKVGQYGGVSIKTGPVKAVAMNVTFSEPNNIVAAFADLTVGSRLKQRLRWQFIPRGKQRIPSGEQSFTFRPEKATGGFSYVGGPAKVDKVNTVQFFLRVRPNKQAGFRITKVLVEK